MPEVWNNVTVYGPPADIQRFKEMCIDPEDQIYRDSQSDWNGCGCSISVPTQDEVISGQSSASEYGDYVTNFQQFTSESEAEYSFSFDSYGAFPVHLFELLATAFPSLSFSCSCIEESDEFMGYGWFNAPPGGEEFRQDIDVPEDYWGESHQKEGLED